MLIRSIDMKDKAEAVEILAEAFYDDPIMNWISDKPAFVNLMFDVTLPIFLPKGFCYKVEGGKGVAVWLGPGQSLKWPFTVVNVFRMLKLLGPLSMFRLAISGNKTEKEHPAAPHYYLFAIGARRQYQGQGVGTSLIKEVLSKCDEEGIPAYLENSREENLKFYQGHGFEVIKEVQFSKSAPTLWMMWRDPR